MKAAGLSFALLFGLLASALSADTPPSLDGIVSPGEYPGTASFGNDRFRLGWRIEGPTLYMAIDAASAGWVSVGFGATFAMDGADMVFGMVGEGGAVEAVDAFSDGPFGPHPPDHEAGGKDDIAGFAGRREGGRVVFEFSRPLATGDGRDVEIPAAGELSLIWATGEDLGFDTGHDAAGSATIDVRTGAVGAKRGARSLLLPLHILLMSLGFSAMLFGAAIARYLKTRRWWLKVHKPLGIAGAACAAAGLVAGALMAQLGGGHFRVPHAFLGAATLLAVLSMPFLGFYIFKHKGDKARIKAAHRWLGRAALLAMTATILSGLATAGIL